MTTYAIDGLPLDDPAGRWNLENSTGLPALSLPENTLITTPFKDGVASLTGPVPTRPITLSIWIRNSPGSSYDQITQTASYIGLIFAHAKELQMIADDNSIKTADIVKVSAADPQKWGGRKGALLVFSLDLNPFWHSPSHYISAAVTANTKTVIPNFDGTTGPARDAIFRLSGPLTAIKMTDPTTGAWLYESRTINPNTYLYINPNTGRAWDSTNTNTWDQPPTATPIEYGPQGLPQFWPTIPPTLGSTALAVTCEPTTTRTVTIVMRGRKWYL